MSVPLDKSPTDLARDDLEAHAPVRLTIMQGQAKASAHAAVEMGTVLGS